MAGYLPPWPHEFRRAPCLLCHNDERVVLVTTGDPSVGICEACAVHVHWTWRVLAGDAAPAEETTQVTKVKVVVSRLAKLPTGELCKADHPGSYEFVMAPGANGYHDFPTAELQPGEKEQDETVALEAAARALESVGLATWPVFLEPLLTAHSPRGSLVRIYLATAYVDVSDRGPSPLATPPVWRRWPPWEHAWGLYGLYASLREIWPLRISVLRKIDPSREQITTRLRKGAAEYIRLQLLLRADPDADVSMAKYLRQSMSDDERAACKKVLELSDLAAEREAEREVPTDVIEGEYREGAEQEDPEDLDTEIVVSGGGAQSSGSRVGAGTTLEEAFLEDTASGVEDDDG
jgi:hypothetical protein